MFDRFDPRDRDRDSRDAFVEGLDLPRGLEREIVLDERDRTYELNGEDSRTLAKDNVRVGFFEREQFLSVLQRLAEPVRPVAFFAYITGWRIDSEVLPLEWRQVDFGAGEVRLDPGRTKNGEGRTFPMTRDLRELLDHQRAITETLQRRLKVVCPRVFHRAGQPIKSFRSPFEQRAPKPDAQAASCTTSAEPLFRISSAPASRSAWRCR